MSTNLINLAEKKEKENEKVRRRTKIGKSEKEGREKNSMAEEYFPETKEKEEGTSGKV